MQKVIFQKVKSHVLKAERTPLKTVTIDMALKKIIPLTGKITGKITVSMNIVQRIYSYFTEKIITFAL